MNRFYTTNWPNELTIDTSWVCEPNKDLAIRFLVYFNGIKGRFDTLIDDNITNEKLAKQLKRRALEEKSTRFLQETLVQQWSEETTKSFPQNPAYSLYSSFVFKNDRGRIESVTKILKEETDAFKELFSGEQALLQITWIHSGGEASRMQRSASAFRWRDGVYQTYIWMRWPEKFLEKDMQGFLLRLRAKLRPFSMMGRASFINFADAMLVNDFERVYYGNNRSELQKIKKIWDKDNYFKWPQGVQLPQTSTPAAPPPMASSSMRMMSMAIDPSLAAGIVAHDGGDHEGADDHEEEIIVDEHILADRIARDQWENYTPPPQNSFVGGLQGLHQLGF
ncbi:hypothetical protein ONZ43_g5426 [Nemania bipapillata]|uniref:Uncharacterized protein n=1 Tax=Nemania bipapillata TaxID=110536 RepID=A0ACC2IAX5_9PEZI|nr:hypothetical protein ONZ43_g5426 [Nemania bipapillata]